jgi:hypothetical protein
MKVNTTPRINADPAMVAELRAHALQINATSEGRIAGAYNAQTAAPTTGTYAQGDFIRNSAPTELGSASSKYVIFGWLYDGSAWLQCRFLTGN